MRKLTRDVICRKCGGLAEFAMTPSNLCCFVRCTSCGVMTESCCSTDDAEMQWVKVNAQTDKSKRKAI